MGDREVDSDNQTHKHKHDHSNTPSTLSNTLLTAGSLFRPVLNSFSINNTQIQNNWL